MNEKQAFWRGPVGLRGSFACSACGGASGVKTCYCRHCGARTENFTSERVQDAEAEKVGGSAFDGVNWKWLLPLLLFPFASDPPRREISVTANVNGKSVIIAYDPHDPEAAKAADVWREALFANGTRHECKEPVTVRPGDDAKFVTPFDVYYDRVNFAVQKFCQGMQEYFDRTRAIMAAAVEPSEPAAETVKSDEPATPSNIGFFWEVDNGEYILRWRQCEGGDADKVIGLSRRPSFPTEKEKFRVKVYHEGHADISGGARDIEAESLEAAMRSAEETVLEELTEHMRYWQNRLSKWKSAKKSAADITELEKAAKPLRDYLKAHGDPHTSVIVTQDGATEAQDERRVKFDGGAI